MIVLLFLSENILLLYSNFYLPAVPTRIIIAQLSEPKQISPPKETQRRRFRKNRRQLSRPAHLRRNKRTIFLVYFSTSCHDDAIVIISSPIKQRLRRKFGRRLVVYVSLIIRRFVMCQKTSYCCDWRLIVPISVTIFVYCSTPRRVSRILSFLLCTR